MTTEAAKRIAQPSITTDTGLKPARPGRTMITTPMKPPIAATARGPVSRSARKTAAIRATQIGMVNSMAKTWASGR